MYDIISELFFKYALVKVELGALAEIVLLMRHK